MARQLSLFVNFNPGLGMHPARWRVMEPTAFLSQDIYIEIARIAERGLLDALFVSDYPTLGASAEYQPWHGLEPSLIAAAMGAHTERIGLISTNSTTYNEPYNLARRIAALDLLTNGRAGWNIVTTFLSDAARNFGNAPLPDKAERYAQAHEFVEVVLELWNSWEPDAIVADPVQNRLVDMRKVHPVGHRGRYYAVEGPLQNPRTPQGHPVLVQAGTSPEGRAFAARYAEVLFVLRGDIPSAVAEYRAFRKQVADFGRDPDGVRIMPGFNPVVGSTVEEAHRIRAELDDLRNWDYDVGQLASRTGVDVTVEDLDTPIGEVLSRAGRQGEHPQGLFAAVARAAELEPGLTVREFVNSSRDSIRQLVGTPEMIADDIEAWFRAGAADGFNLSFSHYTAPLEAFVDHVVPLLQAKGIFRREYEGTTFRDLLGLETPAHTPPAARV